MANQAHLEVLRKGVEEWNKWREANPNTVPDLQGADLRNLDLVGGIFTRTNFRGANLHKAILSNAIFESADLQNTDLRDAYIFGAMLRKVNLRRAILKGATLMATHMDDADLRDANFSGAYLDNMTLNGAKLENCIFDSRLQLRKSGSAISDPQLKSAIFLEDREAREEQKQENKSAPYIKFYFDDDIPWTMEDMSVLCMALQISYSRIYYLSTTREKKFEDITKKISEIKWITDRDNILQLSSIHSGSLGLKIKPLIPNPVTIVCLSILYGCSEPAKDYAKAYRDIQEGRKLGAEAEWLEENTRQFQNDIKKQPDEPQKPTIPDKLLLPSPPSVPDILESLPDNWQNNLAIVSDWEQTPRSMKFANDIVEVNKAELLFEAMSPYMVMTSKLSVYGHATPEIKWVAPDEDKSAS